MPLNPPSYKGQDVWYSPNVYVNKVPVALWKPPQIGDSLIFQFTLPPDPTQPPFSAKVLDFYSNMQADTLSDPLAKDFTVTAGPGVGSTINITPGAAPPNGATDENLAGDPQVTPSPLQLPPGSGPWQTLQANLTAALNEAKQGLWDNSGRNSKNVQACFAELGRAETYSNAWCAAFANTMLKRSGIPYNGKDLFANTFYTVKWGKPIPVNDYNQWRENDILVLRHKHVAFLKGVDPTSGRVEYLGGNQGGSARDNGNLTQVRSRAGGLATVVYVARGWEVPPEIDKPLF